MTTLGISQCAIKTFSCHAPNSHLLHRCIRLTPLQLTKIIKKKNANVRNDIISTYKKKKKNANVRNNIISRYKNKNKIRNNIISNCQFNCFVIY